MTRLEVSDLAFAVEQAYLATTGRQLALRPCQDYAGYDIFLPDGMTMVSRVGRVAFELLSRCNSAGPTAVVVAINKAIESHTAA